MNDSIVSLSIYDKRERSTTTYAVQQVDTNRFKMIENALFNCRLTYGTEFTTRINKEGQHEINKIFKNTDFTTRRFYYDSKYKEADYRWLGEELGKRGGFWQVDAGYLITINIPKDFEYNIDQLMVDLDFHLVDFRR